MDACHRRLVSFARRPLGHAWLRVHTPTRRCTRAHSCACVAQVSRTLSPHAAPCATQVALHGWPPAEWVSWATPRHPGHPARPGPTHLEEHLAANNHAVAQLPEVDVLGEDKVGQLDQPLQLDHQLHLQGAEAHQGLRLAGGRRGCYTGQGGERVRGKPRSWGRRVWREVRARAGEGGGAGHGHYVA